MIARVFVCFVLSILIHVVFFISSFGLLDKPKDIRENIQTVSVNLVDVPSQAAGVYEVKTLPVVSAPQKVERKNHQDAEGVSFEAAGGVGAGYIDKLKVRIFKIWKYPEDAVQKGEQGKVTITFVLNNKGEVVDIGVLASSGSYRLDSAAMAAIKKAGPFGSFTSDIKDKTLKVTGHFRYVLD